MKGNGRRCRCCTCFARLGSSLGALVDRRSSQRWPSHPIASKLLWAILARAVGKHSCDRDDDDELGDAVSDGQNGTSYPHTSAASLLAACLSVVNKQ